MTISINLDKAKNLKKESLRSDRKPLLDQLDIDYMRAQEAGNDTSSIVQKKQQLRDITNAVDSCTTVEELKAIVCE